MDNLIYILFICIVAPLILMLFLLPKKTRLIMCYMVIGVAVALFVSEINSMILAGLKTIGYDVHYVTTTITPVTEEILKAIPVFIYAFFISDDKKKLMPISLALGVGFGFFDNTVILLQNAESVTITWAIARGFSTALMHGVCTLAIGYGLSFVRMKRKLCWTGTFSLLAIAMIYHGVFNMLVESDYRVFGFILPVATYIPLVYTQYLYKAEKTGKK